MNWKEFLEKDNPSNEEWREAIRCAKNFCSCAVGERFNPNYPMPGWNAPVYDESFRLGMRFEIAIQYMDLESARSVYDEIQKL